MIGYTRCPRCTSTTGSRPWRTASVPAFEDWATEETDHSRVIEAAPAHVVPNKVETAYAGSDLFERRRRRMDDWAAYLDGERGQVIPLRR